MDSAHDNSTDDKNGKMVVVITARRLFVFSMILCTSLRTVIGNMPSAPQGMLIGKGDLSTSQAEVREPKVLRKVWIMWQELRWEWQWWNNIKCFKTKVFLKKALHHRKEWVDDVRNYQVACLLDVHLFLAPLQAIVYIVDVKTQYGVSTSFTTVRFHPLARTTLLWVIYIKIQYGHFQRNETKLQTL